MSAVEQSGSVVVPEYRFYKIALDGHVNGSPDDCDALDDLAAIRAAKVLSKEQDIEIWEGSRLVAYVVPELKDAT